MFAFDALGRIALAETAGSPVLVAGSGSITAAGKASFLCTGARGAAAAFTGNPASLGVGLTAAFGTVRLGGNYRFETSEQVWAGAGIDLELWSTRVDASSTWTLSPIQAETWGVNVRQPAFAPGNL